MKRTFSPHTTLSVNPPSSAHASSRKRRRVATPKSTKRAQTPRTGKASDETKEGSDASRRLQNKRLSDVLEMMTPEQLNRYEKCRRSKFAKSTMSRLIKESLEELGGRWSRRVGDKLPEDVVILMAVRA